jgi:hypothetical protein
MFKKFLEKLVRINLRLWGKKTLNYHHLSRKNLKLTPEHNKEKPPNK